MKTAKGVGKKRSAGQASQLPNKKRKVDVAGPNGEAKSKPNTQSKNKGKGRAYDRPTVPIPAVAGDSDSEIDDEDLQFFKEHEGAEAFLNGLDRNGIARSKRETERLHKLSKPARTPARNDVNLSPVSDSDHLSWDDNVEDESLESLEEGDDNEGSSSDASNQSLPDSEAEQPYELQSRMAPDSREIKGPERLPIKLADGQIRKRGNLPLPPSSEAEDEPEDEDSEAERQRAEEARTLARANRTEDVATGARFGRAAVRDIVGTSSRKERIQAAKEQLADICQEIITDPENSLGLLRRLHTFSQATITSPTHPKPIANDVLIRKLAFLSQLAVFKDIIPGYRIRALTEKEKAEKVSQMVMRTREFEQGLVGAYQSYLRVLEAELKANSELTPVALQCMCKLLTDVTHFNFRTNLMSAIVARLSRKSWDELSDLSFQSIITVFKHDTTGQPSLELVRLLNRMVKERHYRVHPKVISSLLHLRLKSELHVRSSDLRADREEKDTGAKLKGKKKEKVHLSKKAKKARKERKEIEQEMEEAEAEVDAEDRAKTHTETLKLLFVLYFRILKNPTPTPLLPVALEGLSRFAHLVNIDFFKDLLAVLKNLIRGKSEEAEGDEEETEEGRFTLSDGEHLRQRLLCIVTAFELLSGQGEALNIDLSEFVHHLYAIILELAMSPSIEVSSTASNPSHKTSVSTASTSDLLFRALSIAFSPRTSQANKNPPWRTAAFCKRLLISSLSWPPSTALQCLEFISNVLVKEPTLDALLSTEDRRKDGVYRPELDDPQLCNPFGTIFWELRLLSERHWSDKVREEAGKLAKFTRS